MQDAVCSIPVKDDERFPCLQKQRGGPLGTRARNRTREEGCMGRGRNRRRDGDATCIIRIPDSTASCKLTARAASSRMVRTADHARVCLPRPTGVRGGSHPQHKCTFASLRTRFGSYCPLVPLTHVMLALVQQKVPSPQGVHATWLRAPVAAARFHDPPPFGCRCIRGICRRRDCVEEWEQIDDGVVH